MKRFKILNEICLTLSIIGFIGTVLSVIYFILFQSKLSVIIGVYFFELFVIGLINWFLTIGLLKAEGKQYTKTFKKKIARNLTQLLYSCINAKDFKVVVTPTDGTRFNLDIEPKEK